MVHFLNFAEHTKQLKGRKIVFILSPQWFQPGGADEMHFAPNFSSLQGYDLAFNNQLDPKLKRKAIKRLLSLNTIQHDTLLKTIYEGEIRHDAWTEQKATFARPVGQVYRYLLRKKDLYYSLIGWAPHKREIRSSVKQKSWKQLEIMAQTYGQKNSTSNSFGINNSRYRWLKHRIPSLKNYKEGSSYGKSIEYKDFQLVLDVLKESGAKPLFVSVPVNGKWYDYIGFPKKGRTDYYQKIKKQVEAEGFPIADFSNHEYDPAFLKDTIHIGWKGWVYTDKAIKDFYDTKPSL